MGWSKKIYYLSNTRLLATLLAFAFIVLIIPLCMNMFSDKHVIINNPSLYHVRIAEDIMHGDFFGGIDELTYFKRPLYVSSFHYLLAGSMLFFGEFFTLNILPIIIGLLTIAILYLVLTKLEVNLKIRLLAISLLIISPVFIFAYSTINAYAFITLFALLGFYFYSREEFWSLIVALAFFILAAFFSRFSIILILIILLSYSLVTSKKQKWFLVVLFTLLLLGFKFVPQMFFEYDTIQKTNILVDFVSDFGAVVGFSIFALVLGVIGLFSSWKEKTKKYPVYLLLILLIYLAVKVNNSFNIYLLFLLSYLAAIGFMRIINIKWNFTILRDLTLIIIVCGLLFSTLSFYKQTSQQDYSEEIKAMTWLLENSPDKSSVLSHYPYGFLIQTIGKRKAVLDPLSAYNIGFESTNDEINQIFISRNLKNTKGMLKKYGVNYIFINNKMKQGLVWDEDDEGLLFLLQNNETFKNVFQSDNTEIWQVLV